MTVYVDRLRKWGVPGHYKNDQAERVGAKHGHYWCHMFSDQGADAPELEALARSIGMRLEWKDRDHYDLVPPKRALALAHGAVEATDAQSVAIWKAVRLKARAPTAQRSAQPPIQLSAPARPRRR